MEIDIDINAIVRHSIAAALSPEALQEIVTAKAQKAVESAISNAFGYKSPIQQLLEAKIAEAMPTDIESLGRFSDLVLKTVTDYIEQTQQQHIQQAVLPKLQRMLAPLPAEMKLSELVPQIVREFEENERYDIEGGAPTVIVEHSDVSDGYWRLYFDPKEGQSKYSCRFEADFTRDNDCYNLKISGENVSNVLLIGPKYNADRLLLNLYTGGVKVIPDETDFSHIEYGGSEED